MTLCSGTAIGSTCWMKPGREADRQGLLCAVAEETGVQPRSREDGQGLWEEKGERGRGREVNWALKRRRRPPHWGSKEGHAFKRETGKDAVLGKGMVYSEKAGPMGLYE